MQLPDYAAIYATRKEAEAAALRPRLVKAADDAEAMRDQLESVIDAGPDDPRFLAARAVLLSPFEERADRPLRLTKAGLARA